ncbi:hypothetical protein [Halobaculum sp. EA56]|uniref:hypothetical protein n=1 Tax=Halobaculum sp. EA56 TaxID=3421648 RepID=UPI003EB98275
MPSKRTVLVESNLSKRQQAGLLALWGLSLLGGSAAIVALEPDHWRSSQPVFVMLVGLLMGSGLLLVAARRFAGRGSPDQNRMLPAIGAIVGVGIFVGGPLVFRPWMYNGRGLAGGITAGATMLTSAIAGIVVIVSVDAYRQNSPNNILTVFAVLSGIGWFYVFLLDRRFTTRHRLELTILWLVLVGGGLFISRQWSGTPRTD